MSGIKDNLRCYDVKGWCGIILCGLAAELSIRYYPRLIDHPNIVEWFHEVLNMPGPGGGLFLPAGIFLVWACIAYGMLEKKGVVLMTALVMLAVSCILGPAMGRRNIFLWSAGWLVLAVCCDLFIALLSGRKLPARIIALLLGALSAVSLVQLAFGIKIWEKAAVWPGAVPVFIVLGFVLAIVMFVKEQPHVVPAVMLSMTAYIAFMWLTIFFPPFKPPVGYPVIVVAMMVSGALAVYLAAVPVILGKYLAARLFDNKNNNG
ncbi:MAG: hypothetical protein KBA61_16750 [Spirochaetes bacterium]|nr:hypothetical protein [Spirochaetota bacterium]